MELFIREKYEHKRYITVENGGLGGQGPNRGGFNNPPASIQAPRQMGSLGTRPIQSSYSIGNQTMQSSSTRFSGFGNASSVQSTIRATPKQLHTSFGRTTQSGFGGSSNDNSTSQLQGAMRRASTLREIMNMGFSTDIAARAVEASNGDLKRALDWVLEQDDQTQTGTKGNQTAQVKTSIPDLLSDVSIAPTMNAPANPKSETTLLNGSKTASQPTKTDDAFADFADFGDFESALPAASSKVTEASSQINSTPGAGFPSGDALRKLYEQGPKPQAPQPGLTPSAIATKIQSPLRQALAQRPVPNISPLRKPMGTPMNTSPSKPWPGLQEKPDFNLTSAPNKSSSLPSSAINKPLTPITMQSQLPPTKSTMSALVASQNALVSNSGAPKNASSLSPSPPPPPPEETAIVETSAVPPPTAPPPVNANDPAESEQKELKDASPAEDQQAVETTEDSTPEDHIEDDKKVDDEDPFAALSMMALSSAKSDINNKPAKTPIVGVSSKLQKPVANTNLDELLG